MFSSLSPVFALLFTVIAQGQNTAVSYVSEPGIHGLVAHVEIGSYDGDDSLFLTTPIESPPRLPLAGPMIYDRNGSLVWIGSAEFGLAFDLQMQTYRGRQVLTVWNGTLSATDGQHGMGTCWIVDDTYRVIESINSVGGGGADIHECNIPEDTESTAMITVYTDIHGFDLSSFGGPVNGTLVDCWVQEIDIATGHVLFNWSMFEHVSPYDSFAVPGDGTANNSIWDAYHMNSIEKAADGNYLISSRHLHQLLFIDKHNGSLIWRMGGKTSNFTIGNGAQFEWQHHARFNPEDNTRISLFDDGAATWGGSVDEPIAHGLYISYDTSSWTVTKLQEFFPEPFQNFSTSQGSMQRFSNGTAVVGFGSNPWITEHASNGSVTFSLSLGLGSLENGPIQSYRAFKVDWTGNPTKPPALALQNNTAFFSWNGKTAVRSYDILGGASPNSLHTRTSVNRAGFETNASLAHFSDELIAVLARDKHGVKLGTSAVLHVANGTVAAAMVQS